ncbi:UNKNOWN [Stylonychia lemnae]|uniref:Uncharacterized protein n=1 Tax=Stylonychia lemnae TaxID=5949 RepID=A0A078BC95_STYLE|nr:UNKNOWN [Stylonychia lemnae]|eukprot:CDW91218.1 UNKNOWN [Stylonychia lemnae]
MPSHVTSSQATSNTAKKNFVLKYDPENNKNNIFARKLNKEMPKQNEFFSENPLTKIMQPTDVTKSKRFVRDKLNISDIPGAQSDVYRKYRNIEGREYINSNDIAGAQPAQLKQNKPMTGPDYKLYTKDINPDKWQTKRMVDPLKPEYDVPTKSGRLMRIGQIEKSAPKVTISPQTKRLANYVGDIEGSRPKQFHSINDEQRANQGQSSKSSDFQIKPYQLTRNKDEIHNKDLKIHVQDQYSYLPQQNEKVGPPPNSHYARFQTYQTGQNPNQSNPIFENNQKHSTILNEQSPIITKSAYRQKYNSQVEPGENVYTLNKTYEPPSSLQQISLNQRLQDRVFSKRQSVNTYDLLQPQGIQPNVNSSSTQEINKIYFNSMQGSSTPKFHQSSDNLHQPMISESPQIQERLWSKGKYIGQEVDNQNSRINSQNGRISSIERSINMKKNFNENLFQKGILINSAQRSFINNGQNPQINPLNNEVTNVSADHSLMKRPIPMSRDQRLALKNPNNSFNPVTSQTNNYGQLSPYQNSGLQASNRSGMVSKNLLPPTTSKTYGNFLDNKQIDQMITQLKQQNMNPII